MFVVASIVIVLLTYWLTSASLAQRDQQIIQQKIGEYAAAYQRGGLGRLAETVRAEQSTAPERLFVRVVDRGAEAIVLSQPEGWEPSALETASRAALGRHAGAGGEEHRSAAGSARQIPRGPRRRHAVDRRRRARWRVHRDARRPGADPETDRSGRPNHQDRPDRRTRPDVSGRRSAGCDRRVDDAVQRDARQDRRARHRHARRAGQCLARSADAAHAAARNGGDGARRRAGRRSMP